MFPFLLKIHANSKLSLCIYVLAIPVARKLYGIEFVLLPAPGALLMHVSTVMVIFDNDLIVLKTSY